MYNSAIQCGVVLTHIDELPLAFQSAVVYITQILAFVEYPIVNVR